MRTLDFVGPEGYVHGWKFVGIPGVTPHTDLLRMRTESRAAHPAGHPERLKAENAVRKSRKLGMHTGTPEAPKMETTPGENPMGRLGTDWASKVSKLAVPDSAVEDAMQNAHDRGLREEASDGGEAFWKAVHAEASEYAPARAEKPASTSSMPLVYSHTSSGMKQVAPEGAGDVAAVLAKLSPSEREHIAKHYEVHVVSSGSIRPAINHLGINAANVDYGHPTGLHHENKLLVTKHGVSNGDLLHEIGHAIDQKHGGISSRNTPGHDEFGLRLNGAISRELRASGNVNPHFDQKQAAGSAAKERFAELYSQYRSGKRQYKLGSPLSSELNSKLTDYFGRQLGGNDAADARRKVAEHADTSTPKGRQQVRQAVKEAEAAAPITLLPRSGRKAKGGIHPSEVTTTEPVERTGHTYPTLKEQRRGVVPTTHKEWVTSLRHGDKHLGSVHTDKQHLGSHLSTGNSKDVYLGGGDTQFTALTAHVQAVEKAKGRVAAEVNARRARAALSGSGFGAVKSHSTSVKGWRNYDPGHETSATDTGVRVDHYTGSSLSSGNSSDRAAKNLEAYAQKLEEKGFVVDREMQDGKLVRLHIPNEKQGKSGLSLSADTARLVATPDPYGKPNGPGLYGQKGNKHSNYFEHIVQALKRSGKSDAEASQMAWGILRRWSRGGGHVTPQVQAAATAALAEEEGKAKRAKAMSRDDILAQPVELFNTMHGAVGSGHGGQFVSKTGGSGGAAAKSPKGKTAPPPANKGTAEKKAEMLGQAKALRTQANGLQVRLNGLVHQLNAGKSTSHGGSKATGTTTKGKTAKAKKATTTAKKAATTTAKAATKTTSSKAQSTQQLTVRIAGLRVRIRSLRIQAATLALKAKNL